MLQRIFTSDFWVGFGRHAAELTATRGILILALIIGYFLIRAALYRVLEAAMARLMARHEREGQPEEHANRIRTLQGLVKSVCSFVLLFILIVMVLDAVGANISG